MPGQPFAGLPRAVQTPDDAPHHRVQVRLELGEGQRGAEDVDRVGVRVRWLGPYWKRNQSKISSLKSQNLIGLRGKGRHGRWVVGD